MTKQDIKFIIDQIKHVMINPPEMSLSDWEVWTLGAGTVHSEIMEILYDLYNNLSEYNIKDAAGNTLSTIPPKVKKDDE